MTLFERLLVTQAPAAVLLIRLIVGGVFLSEGIQQCLFPSEVGGGRFTKIGIPAPEIMAPVVGVFEVSCGALLLIRLLTRLAAIPMIIKYDCGHCLDENSYPAGPRLLRG